MTAPRDPRAGLYDRVAAESAGIVIRRYSTSFGLASRLLAPGVRSHVENIYALVRLADEIVDGEAGAAGLTAAEAEQILNDLEHETEFAMSHGYSANLIVHAFGRTARASGFDQTLTKPFFESMRADLSITEHDRESFERYVYGSAEVVGLMCLRVFVQGTVYTALEMEQLEAGARALGAAFQKVNFLRDLSEDYGELGRSYFPGLRIESFSDTDKNRILDDIDADLKTSASVVRRLPSGSRRAVSLAQSIFTDLAARLRATPAERLVKSRVRVPNRVKLRIAAGAAAGRTPRA